MDVDGYSFPEGCEQEGYSVSSVVSKFTFHRSIILECLCVRILKGADQRPNLAVNHIQQTSLVFLRIALFTSSPVPVYRLA